MKKTTHWDNAAEWYQTLLEKPSTYQRQVILPNLLRLMAITPDQQMVDVGCGNGFFTVAFAEQGAHVVGVDNSQKLIDMAHSEREKLSTSLKEHLKFHCASADDLSFISSKSVEGVTFILSIQNMESLQSVLKEAARILKSEGKIFFVMNHPAFRISDGSSWGWDEEHKVQFRRIDQYLSESMKKIQIHPGSASDQYTLSFHRPLQLYCKALFKAGFLLEGFEEWISPKSSQEGPRKSAEDRARKEIPLFLCLVGIKMNTNL